MLMRLIPVLASLPTNTHPEEYFQNPTTKCFPSTGKSRALRTVYVRQVLPPFLHPNTYAILL